MNTFKVMARYLISIIVVIVAGLLFWGNYPLAGLAMFSLGMIGLYVSTLFKH